MTVTGLKGGRAKAFGMMEGDWFISASAGTGKTHAISSAYLDIFEEAMDRGRELGVENVVAITFTRKAAAEMKSRILKMMRSREGSHPGWQALHSSMSLAWISTIDSFASRILSEVGIYAEVDPRIRVGPESVISAILGRSVDGAIRDRQDLLDPLLMIYTAEEVYQALFEAVGQRRHFMLQARPAGSLQAGYPLHSDGVTAGVLAEATAAFKVLFDQAYRSFREEMAEENLTDFAGVLTVLRDILSSPRNSWIRERYRRQFRYIIVDEFQDTDSLQKEILDLLRGPESRIIFVGDAKQSIFRFRGAEVEVFSRSREEVRSRGGEVRPLVTNYRSHPQIIDFCNAFYPLVFASSSSPCSQSYEPVQALAVSGEAVQSGKPGGSKKPVLSEEPGVDGTAGALLRRRVKVLYHPRDEAEAAASYIQSLVGREFEFVSRPPDFDGRKLAVSRRAVRYGDLAILLRKMRPDRGREYMRALARRGIPYYAMGESGFFEMPEIAGVLAALKLLCQPGDEQALAAALISPLVGLDLQEMARLKYRARLAGTGVFEVLGQLAELPETDVAPGRLERLQRLHQVVEKLLPVCSLIKPSDLVERMVEELDYPAYLAAGDVKGTKTPNLRKFILSARRLDEVGMSLRELVRMLYTVGLDDVEQASIEGQETDAVKIMTVHKAKGLEFPIVIVGDTSWSHRNRDPLLLFSDSVPDSVNDSISGFSLDLSPESSPEPSPESSPGSSPAEDCRMFFTLNCRDEDPAQESLVCRLAARERERDMEEEKRSLYVATTRASDMLILTFSGQRDRGVQPWRGLITEHLLRPDGEAVALAPGFEGLAEVVAPPEDAGAQAPDSGREVFLETRYLGPARVERFREYVSPTALLEAIEPESSDAAGAGSAGQGESGDREESLRKGLLAHRILEGLGGGRRLEEILGCLDRGRVPAGGCRGPVSGGPGTTSSPGEAGPAGVEETEGEEVRSCLWRLRDHPLVREMEEALQARDEYPVVRPSGRYMLYGRPDKLIRLPEGWKLVDFKYAGSASYSEKHEMQMKFYLYLAGELFRPLLGGEILYLKDGGTRTVGLEEGEVERFEERLRELIAKYQESLTETFMVDRPEFVLP